MADCFSLPNAAEILKNIRWMYADEYWVQRAADAIEALLAENAKLKAELDAAVADLRSIAPCSKCKHFGAKQVTCDALEDCLYGEVQAWEWRGVQYA